MKMVKFRLFTYCLPLVFAGVALAQNLRSDLERYQKMPLSDILPYEQDLEKNPRRVVAEVTRKLNEFYLSDTSQKKIQQEQDVNIHLPYEYEVKKEWNVNIQRLFMRNLLSTQANRFLIKEAPNLYAAHHLLARAYMKLNKPYHAAYHYGASLRYRSLKLSPEVFTNPDRLSLLPAGSAEKKAATQFRKLMEDARKEQKEIQRLKEETIVESDNLQRQKESDRKLLEDQLRRNRELLARQKQKNKELLKKVQEANQIFQDYANAYNNESAEFLVESSDLVRKIEDSIKERQKVINRKALYKTSFNQTLLHDYSQNRNYVAYANLLEMASRLAPENAEIPFRLATEYKSSRQTRRAIYAFRRSLEANQKSSKLDEQKIAFAYRSLGGLYFQVNRYVDAASYYEKAYELEKNPTVKENLTFQLAKIHVEKTGNYRRAEILLRGLLDKMQTLNPTDPEDRARWLETRLKSRLFLARIKGKLKQPSQKILELEKALKAHEELEALLSEKRAELAKIFRQLQESKKPLLKDTRDSDLSVYYRNKSEYENTQNLIASLDAIRNALPLKKLYFELAEYYERKNAIAAAMQTYTQAEKKGIAPDAARREMNRLRRQYY